MVTQSGKAMALMASSICRDALISRNTGKGEAGSGPQEQTKRRRRSSFSLEALDGLQDAIYYHMPHATPLPTPCLLLGTWHYHLALQCSSSSGSSSCIWRCSAPPLLVHPHAFGAAVLLFFWFILMLLLSDYACCCTSCLHGFCLA